MATEKGGVFECECVCVRSVVVLLPSGNDPRFGFGTARYWEGRGEGWGDEVTG